ncbi:HAD family hydrolase [Acinetobacter baumannii]|uniref:HAD family hydrolase n=1 Tax=Acinetobacter calcoaceticus/baumannii complex TaxID=909768 RepID=UPI0004537570|nr:MULTISPECIES: HAD family hydrolase [Acinetobacter calcoaceticus/baumannii complex]EXD17607.1 HAD hydrolase, IA, variant 1 family protein [Acinetobacter baumannii 1297]MBN6530916.1 HAD family hydrolase [Acinetobacter pittii]MCF1330814.1 HAD family hydrolase [Acinetobacter baumannii]MCK0911524.1 HAD family hydrolase [Acinetobacter pittii]MCP9134452.1 HAD family hydrolase [Acinetobacter baumannii]
MEKSLKEYQAIIFDMDGTLVDSFSFFLGALNQLAKKHKFKSVELHEVEQYKHLSPKEIMKEMNVSKWKLPWIAKDFIRLMKERDQEVYMFEGMRDHLIELHKRGYTLAIITSNSKENCQSILGKELCELFSHIDGGSSIFGKAKRIKRVLNILNLNKEQAIYVGDQTTDGEAAHKAGIDFAAVGWGYTSAEKLKTIQPKVVLNDLATMKEFF